MHQAASRAAVLSLIVLAACANTGSTDSPTVEVVPPADSAAALETNDPPSEISIADRLTTTALARWRFIEDDDWVASFDFLAPAWREQQGLEDYLEDARYHQYELTGGPRFVGELDGLLYIWVEVDWTPTHPEIQDSSNFTQSIAMIEAWQAVDGELYFTGVEREQVARERFPELFRDFADPTPGISGVPE